MANDQRNPRLILEFERPVIELERKIEELRGLTSERIDMSSEIRKLEQKARNLQKEVFAELTPQQKVQLSRHPSRPYMSDYIDMLFSDFHELHGDRQVPLQYRAPSNRRMKPPMMACGPPVHA